jgi:hypothetical protein
MASFLHSTHVLDYAPGEGMKSEVHEDVYRLAFESATSELIEISAAFEELRVRKDRIERLVEVLKPLVEVEEQPAVSAEQAVELPAHPDANDDPEPVLSDPFQRRIDHVLGIGAGIRDVRKYSRQF